ncbi:MAG: gliding motility-associated C-terminal domain-containing protein [Chitinophagaceae bacterium]|nr:MAG: gliding motility-associated C-terminal domain-containing protein [Chitinophagaceae bacterium]
MQVETPAFSVTQFTWPSIATINFQNSTISIATTEVQLQKNTLCNLPQGKPLQKESICEGQSLLLEASQTISSVWNTGQSGSSITVTEEGRYWARSLTTSGCYITDSFQVTKTPLPVVNLGADTSICKNDQLQLTAGNNGAKFTWNTGQTAQTIIAKDSGLYVVDVEYDGCTASDSILVRTLSIPALNVLGEQTICQEAKATLSADGAQRYSWFPVIGLSSSSGAAVEAGPLVTTTYYVTGFASNGCSTTDSVVVTITPKPELKAVTSVPVLCLGDTAVLSASGGDRYTWSPVLLVEEPGQNITKAYPTTNTRYKVIIEEDRCGLTDSLFVDIGVAPKPAIKIEKSNDINCFVSKAVLTATGGEQYLWGPSAGLSDVSSNRPIVQPTATTTYTVQVTSAAGCMVKDSITIIVLKNEVGGYPVPTAFTPNGDGKNDCFGVRSWGDVQEFSLKLFNRWGELVFQSSSTNNCWNGYYKGQLQPDGAYVYLIQAKTMCGDVFRKGTFLLIR